MAGTSLGPEARAYQRAVPKDLQAQERQDVSLSLWSKDCEFSLGTVSITAGPNSGLCDSPAFPHPAPGCLRPVSPHPYSTHKPVASSCAAQIKPVGQAPVAGSDPPFLVWLSLLPTSAPRAPQSNPASSLLPLCLSACAPAAPRAPYVPPPLPLILPDPPKHAPP